MTGNTAGISAVTAATVTVAGTGTVNGGAGGAILFNQAGAFADRLELVSGAIINGNVVGGPGTDTLGLSGTGRAASMSPSSSRSRLAKRPAAAAGRSPAPTPASPRFRSAAAPCCNGSLSNAALR